MKKIKTSALIGLGALGILFGRKMPGVQVIADENRIARYSAEPVVCNGEACSFRYVTPAEGKPVDLLLVAVKATVLEQAIRDMKKFIGPDTIILSVLNGITSEEDIEAVYPGHCLWSVAIGMDATRVGRSLTFGAPGRIQFGEKNGEMTDRVRAVDEYLTACGIASEPCSDILFKQWSKLMVNDGLNQAAAAFDLPYGGLTKPGPAYDKMLEAMQEVIDLSVLEGVNLPADNHKAFLESMAPTFKPDGMPSMRQDVLAQRPTEVEEFAGVVRRLAKKHGMPTPANDFFYEKIREIEAGYHKE
jgi:2-dehydropantoate 2-reductase